jgi:type IV secretion system protein VirB9
MRKRLVMLLLLLVPMLATAESVPHNGRYDDRIKSVDYNPANVVRIVGHYGYSTDIEFAPGEHVKTIALGDSLAWDVAPSGSHLFVKPREDDAVTNATVVTNKHVYQFALDARHVSGVTGPRSAGMYFVVRFRYPQNAEARAQQASLLAQLDSPTKPVNWDYYACGARALWPSQVYDDGRFTYLRFPNAQAIPAVFIINADGTESLVNGEMQGDEYVVQATARRLVLRRGKAVACIQNRNYNPRGIATPTDTVSPDVKRTIRAQAPRGEMDPAPASVTPTSHATGSGATASPLPPTVLPSPRGAAPAQGNSP